jgi:hypothetical protein
LSKEHDVVPLDGTDVFLQGDFDLIENDVARLSSLLVFTLPSLFGLPQEERD